MPVQRPDGIDSRVRSAVNRCLRERRYKLAGSPLLGSLGRVTRHSYRAAKRDDKPQYRNYFVGGPAEEKTFALADRDKRIDGTVEATSAERALERYAYWSKSR